MSKDRTDKIVKIAKHFAASSYHTGSRYYVQGLIMDIMCVDKIHNLDLDSMLDDLDSFHVAHDVFGIHKYLDRETKQLTKGWTPRFGRDWEECQDAQSFEHDQSLIQDDNGKVIGRRRGLHRDDNWLD